MAVKGVITRLVPGKDFFFIDKDYFCHLSKVNFKPENGMEVEYERAKNKDGKPEARNVKPIGKIINPVGFFNKYLEQLSKGYFIKEDFIKKEFVLDYAKELADEFTKNGSINKPSQIRKYFDYCDKVNGIYKVRRDFLYVQAELPKVISHLNNALKKGLISKDFVTFVEKNVDLAIIEEKNFIKGFIPHFEAVIGFSQK